MGAEWTFRGWQAHHTHEETKSPEVLGTQPLTYKEKMTLNTWHYWPRGMQCSHSQTWKLWFNIHFSHNLSLRGLADDIPRVTSSLFLGDCQAQSGLSMFKGLKQTTRHREEYVAEIIAGPQIPKHFLCGPLQKKLVDPSSWELWNLIPWLWSQFQCWGTSCVN